MINKNDVCVYVCLYVCMYVCVGIDVVPDKTGLDGDFVRTARG